MSGGFNPVNLVSQAALAVATGGSSLVAQLAMQLVSQIAKDVIQQVGQELGLPQPMIDMAQGALSAATGDAAGAAQEYSQAAHGFADGFRNAGELAQSIGDRLGATPSQSGELQRTVSQGTDAIKEQAKEYLKQALEGKDEEGNANGAKKLLKAAKGESFLVQLAMILGHAIDGKMNEQMKLAKEIDGARQSKDESHMSENSAKLTALGQEINLMSNSLNTTLKSVGEALSTIARKN